MTTSGDRVQALTSTGVPTLGYIVATKPALAKACSGIVHATSEDAFAAIEAMDADVARHLNVYEVLTYVAPDPMPPSMKMGS